ncbi:MULTISPECIES: PAAR domain-containing protein [Ralstonia]
MLIDGQPAALHGDMTECGATLIGDGSAVVI